MPFESYQNQLLQLAKSNYQQECVLSDEVCQAFTDVPRHWFVNRYRTPGMTEWSEVTGANLDAHLDTLYADRPLILYGSDDDYFSKDNSKQVSTISQPSFVLHLLDLLQLKKGHKVFELGTASGWNAALISNIVGSQGYVVSVEIISALAETAKKTLQKNAFDNVLVLSGDGGDGYADKAPYDRIIFTAGSYDLPLVFLSQLKEGGLLLFVLKNKGSADNLIVLKKYQDHFRALSSMSCTYVPMTGKYGIADMESQSLDTILVSHSISNNIISERNFWWGSGSKAIFQWHTSGLQSFLSLYDNFLAVNVAGKDHGHFAWLDDNSLAYAVPGKLIVYGNDRAAKSLIACLTRWITLGMPTLSDFELSVYPSNFLFDKHSVSDNETWVFKRNDATFVWQLPIIEIK